MFTFMFTFMFMFIFIPVTCQSMCRTDNIHLRNAKRAKAYTHSTFFIFRLPSITNKQTSKLLYAQGLFWYHLVFFCAVQFHLFIFHILWFYSPLRVQRVYIQTFPAAASAQSRGATFWDLQVQLNWQRWWQCLLEDHEDELKQQHSMHQRLQWNQKTKNIFLNAFGWPAQDESLLKNVTVYGETVNWRCEYLVGAWISVRPFPVSLKSLYLFLPLCAQRLLYLQHPSPSPGSFFLSRLHYYNYSTTNSSCVVNRLFRLPLLLPLLLLLSTKNILFFSILPITSHTCSRTRPWQTMSPSSFSPHA